MSFLHGVEVIELDGGPRPISSVASSVIGLVGTAKKGPVNEAVLIAGSRKEAVDQFGEPDGVSTIPDALDAIFDQVGALVVVINVQDKEAVAASNYTLLDGTTELLDEYVSNVIVEGIPETSNASDDSSTQSTKKTKKTQKASDKVVYKEGVDYVVLSKAGKSGNDVIQVLPEGALNATSTLSVSYEKAVDITQSSFDAIKSSVIGGADKGIQALLGAENSVHVTPRLLIAPGFTHDNAVTTDLVGVADKLRAIAIADGPNSGDSDAINYRKEFGSARLYLIDPSVKVFDSVTQSTASQPASARVAGIIARSDNERGFWWSPSNRAVMGITGTARPIDFAMGDSTSRANLLNENEVATIIRQDGYRLWGNRSCSSDPKFAFISVRRTADMINDALLRAHLWAVDRNITKTYIEDVTEGVNNYLRSLKNQGAIIDGVCWADPELNTPDQIVQGKVYFDFDFTPPYPAEHITFRSHLVNDYLEEIFS